MKTLFYSIALIFAMIACSKEEPIINANDNSGDATLRWLTEETAFAKSTVSVSGSGDTVSYVFNAGNKGKANPEGLGNLNLITNRWGWAANLPVPTTSGVNFSTWFDIYVGAGLNDINKGMKVGGMNVTRSNTSITINCVFPDWIKIYEVHLYVSPNKPTTAAPGQYGYPENYSIPGGAGSYNTVIPYSGHSNVWIIAHFTVSSI